MAAPTLQEKPISADETTMGAEQTAATVEKKPSTDVKAATRQPAFATAMNGDVPARLTGVAAPVTPATTARAIGRTAYPAAAF